MTMYLAAHLGYASPSKMLREMSASEWAAWRLYYVKTRFGELRQDERIARAAAGQVQVHAKRGRTIQPKSFMPITGWPAGFAPKKTVSALLAKVIGLNAHFGGKDLRPKENGGNSDSRTD